MGIKAPRVDSARFLSEVGMEWPEAFEIATREHLARNLKVTLPGRPTSGSDVAPA